ncbi:SDR family oxidoreductase [Niallia sp. JL1B1071]|uniref:SDR family oxidoreductase n=1 Tax=Niallia tiangongensis TaxID=3237105 RepID=UPI0037DD0A33
MKSLQELFSLENKVAFISGASGHLGSAISESLAECGANVVLAGRNQENNKRLAEKLANQFGVICLPVYLDISSRDSITNCVELALKEFEKVDILINNASYGSTGKIESMSDKDWEIGIDGTINQTFRLTNSILPYMVTQGSGNIINISSMYGVVSPNPEIYGDSGQNNPPNYGVGKAAIIQFTKYIACHYGKEGIRANCLSPGPFPKPEVLENGEFINQLACKNPLGRVGRPEELKGAIAYLASDASSFVTGHNLSVDGGWTAW